ncbi:MAG: HAD hydrolase family protein [Elusimicrobiota bacterium]|nr:MAG: HAD hydrolase family protein [Elusimicrobiota bacterium]
MAWLTESGLVTGVISGRVSKGTDARLRLLKVKHIYQHRLDKADVLAEIIAAEGVSKDDVVYVGDDIPDLAVMSRVGLAVAPANARPEVKAAAHYVTKATGETARSASSSRSSCAARESGTRSSPNTVN